MTETLAEVQEARVLAGPAGPQSPAEFDGSGQPEGHAPDKRAPEKRAPEMAALEMYDAALATAVAGGTACELAVATDGRWSRVDMSGWLGDLRGPDLSLLARCSGPTLDVGCGPGRLTAAVAAAGQRALGVDVSPTAVRLTRQRGGAALCRSVFQRLPAEGRWQHVVLADGNVGIGGNPVRLLARCRSLLAAAGTVLVELDAPGTGSGTSLLRLRNGRQVSRPFRWARVDADDLEGFARSARLRARERWAEDGRWFASLTCA